MTNKYLLSTLFLPLFVCAQQVTTVVNDPSTRFRDDLIFDTDGNLYCADYGGNSVYKRTPDGTVTTFASGFNTPNGLAFDSQQNLFVADNAGNRIYKLNSSGQFLDTFQITGPSGLIKMPDSDTLLFTDYPGNSIRKLAPDGIVIPCYSGLPIDGAVGMAWSPDQRLYLANFSNSQVFEVVFGATVTLDSITTLPPPASGSSWLGFIEYAQGYIWATAYNANKIYKIDPIDGQVTLVAGTTLGNTDGDVSVAQFNKPNGIVANATGDTLYVSDYGTGRLRMITAIPLSLNEQIEVGMKVSPNPTSESFHLSFTHYLLPDKVQLLDMTGRVMKDWFHPQLFDSFSIMELPKGCYLLKVISGNVHFEQPLFIQ